MKYLHTKTGARATGALLLILALNAAGCGFGGTEREESSAGDPESNQRAEMRVGADDGKGKDGKADTRTLYERLGGTPGITAIVDDMLPRSIADPRVNFERKEVRTNWVGRKYKAWVPSAENYDQLRHHMVQFLSLAAGGPAEYAGREMGPVHKGMRITNSEFDAMVGDIKTSMDRLKIGTREKRDMLAIVETTRKQIVEKQ